MPPLTALSRTGISNVVTKYARLAGLEGVYAHRLRHTLASQVLSAGGTIRQVSELLGHTDPASAMSYARVDMAPLRGMAPPWGRLP
ncbi:tyrosine-type recombinase/integrase [Nesterenkonia cremea]|nr:tyrosine-type recombinase/integrase [Nesterenkonia cremea]